MFYLRFGQNKKSSFFLVARPLPTLPPLLVAGPLKKNFHFFAASLRSAEKERTSQDKTAILQKLDCRIHLYPLMAKHPTAYHVQHTSVFHAIQSGICGVQIQQCGSTKAA